MINHKHLDVIVRGTLEKMGVVDPVMTRLIKGTFLFESNLEEFFDTPSPQRRKRGMMMMDDQRFEQLLRDFLKYRTNFKDKILAATGINVDSTSVDSMKFALETNIAFMVAITYVFFLSKYKTPPKDSLEDIASCYRDCYYDGQFSAEIIHDFAEYYRDIFIDKY